MVPFFSTFQSKIEMLESVRILQQLGFTLYASMGTADFYQDHGVDVSNLECVCIENISVLYSIDEGL